MTLMFSRTASGCCCVGCDAKKTPRKTKNKTSPDSTDLAVKEHSKRRQRRRQKEPNQTVLASLIGSVITQQPDYIQAFGELQ